LQKNAEENYCKMNGALRFALDKLARDDEEDY
jgi:hypothetical protein